MFFFNGKSVIINNNRSLYKTNIGRKKGNYKIDVSYISGTPMNKAKNIHNLVKVHF
jgi:hypothetical protein